MNKTIEKIQRRIKTREALEGKKINEIQITKKEAEILGEIKRINGVKIIIVENLKDMTKIDCFAYINTGGRRSCYCLDKLYCTNEICKFYKKCNFNTNDNIPAIERSIKEYAYKRGEI